MPFNLGRFFSGVTNTMAQQDMLRRQLGDKANQEGLQQAGLMSQLLQQQDEQRQRDFQNSLEPLRIAANAPGLTTDARQAAIQGLINASGNAPQRTDTLSPYRDLHLYGPQGKMFNQILGQLPTTQPVPQVALPQITLDDPNRAMAQRDVVANISNRLNDPDLQALEKVGLISQLDKIQKNPNLSAAELYSMMPKRPQGIDSRERVAGERIFSDAAKAIQNLRSSGAQGAADADEFTQQLGTYDGTTPTAHMMSMQRANNILARIRMPTKLGTFKESEAEYQRGLNTLNNIGSPIALANTLIGLSDSERFLSDRKIHGDLAKNILPLAPESANIEQLRRLQAVQQDPNATQEQKDAAFDQSAKLAKDIRNRVSSGVSPTAYNKLLGDVTGAISNGKLAGLTVEDLKPYINSLSSVMPQSDATDFVAGQLKARAQKEYEKYFDPKYISEITKLPQEAQAPLIKEYNAAMKALGKEGYDLPFVLRRGMSDKDWVNFYLTNKRIDQSEHQRDIATSMADRRFDLQRARFEMEKSLKGVNTGADEHLNALKAASDAADKQFGSMMKSYKSDQKNIKLSYNGENWDLFNSRDPKVVEDVKRGYAQYANEQVGGVPSQRAQAYMKMMAFINAEQHALQSKNEYNKALAAKIAYRNAYAEGLMGK